MNSQCQKFLSLHFSGEVETGSAGEQPVRNSLTDWNGHGGSKSPQFHRIILENYVLENPTKNISNQNVYCICKPVSGLIFNIKNVTV